VFRHWKTNKLHTIENENEMNGINCCPRKHPVQIDSIGFDSDRSFIHSNPGLFSQHFGNGNRRPFYQINVRRGITTQSIQPETMVAQGGGGNALGMHILGI